MDVKTGLECVISDIKSFLLSAIKKDIRHPVMTLVTVKRNGYAAIQETQGEPWFAVCYGTL